MCESRKISKKTDVKRKNKQKIRKGKHIPNPPKSCTGMLENGVERVLSLRPIFTGTEVCAVVTGTANIVAAARWQILRSPVFSVPDYSVVVHHILVAVVSGTGRSSESQSECETHLRIKQTFAQKPCCPRAHGTRSFYNSTVPN